MKPLQILFAALALSSFAAAQTKVTHVPFGKTPAGASVELFTLADNSLNVRIISYGAHIISIKAPDKQGKIANIVLGYDTLKDYLVDTTHMGAVPGRYANRIGKGTFELDGKRYHLPLNDHGNTLHGGTDGFDRRVWTGSVVPNGVELTLVSPDGDQGFPGKLTAHVRYTLVGKKLRIDYSATTDKPTVVNLTNHTYFNLAGSGNILSDVVTIDADHITPVDATLIPTGKLELVAGTPFDFRKPTAVGARIHATNEQLKFAGGYDHNFVLNHPGDLSHPAINVTDPSSGRTLTVYTTEPGVQFYSGNFLDGTFKDPSGHPYLKNAGLCLETQHYPDSPNKPGFPSTTLRPGGVYRTSTIFEFGVTK